MTTTRSGGEPSRAPARPGDPPRDGDDVAARTRLHLRFGWWALFAFLGLGAILEGLHAFKLPYYLAVSNETRRLLWTLAHAHGTLLAVVNVAFALSLRALNRSSKEERRLASRCLVGATIFLPAGFFLGGAFPYAGDPGPGVLLVPLGALLLAIAVFITARAVGRPERGGSPSASAGGGAS